MNRKVAYLCLILQNFSWYNCADSAVVINYMDYLCDTVSVHPQYAKSILISLITTGLSPGKLWVGLQLLIVINRAR